MRSNQLLSSNPYTVVTNTIVKGDFNVKLRRRGEEKDVAAIAEPDRLFVGNTWF